MVAMTIVEFLTARMDEDEAAAEEAIAKVERTGYWSGVDLGPAVSRLLFHQRFTPPRVLAEVKAKRRVLTRHSDDGYGNCQGCGHEYADISLRYTIDECPELRDLAGPYNDHPDYKPAWRVQ